MYKALGSSVFEVLKQKNILFEGWYDKKLFQTALGKLIDGQKKYKKTFKDIGIAHSRGVKYMKCITPVFEAANRGCLILSDNDETAKQNDWIDDSNYTNYDMAHAIMPTETLTRKEVQHELWKCYQHFYGRYVKGLAGIFSKNKLKRTLYRHMAGQHVLRKFRRLI